MKNNLKLKSRKAANAKGKAAVEWPVASPTASIILGIAVSVPSGADHRPALWQNPVAIKPKTTSKMPIFQVEPTATKRKKIRIRTSLPTLRGKPSYYTRGS